MHKMAGGPERFILSLALVVPLVIAALSLNQLAGTSVAAPSLTLAHADATTSFKRPIASQKEVPPTLAVPTSTPRPTATPVPPTPVVSPTPRTSTYTVKPGDELRHIAADYQVNIFKIIKSNDIPDPDNLRVGQVLRIPDN